MAKQLTKRQVINKLQIGLKIHEHWSEYLRGNPTIASQPDNRITEEVVGSAEWHDEWVAIYKRTIELLEAK